LGLVRPEVGNTAEVAIQHHSITAGLNIETIGSGKGPLVCAEVQGRSRCMWRGGVACRHGFFKHAAESEPPPHHHHTKRTVLLHGALHHHTFCNAKRSHVHTGGWDTCGNIGSAHLLSTSWWYPTSALLPVGGVLAAVPMPMMAHWRRILTPCRTVGVCAGILGIPP